MSDERYDAWRAMGEEERQDAWRSMSDAERDAIMRAERWEWRAELLRRYDGLVEAAIEARAFGPLRLERYEAREVVSGITVLLDPSEQGLVVRDELTRRWEIVTDLEGLLAKAGAAALTISREAFERLETATLDAIRCGGEANQRQAVLDGMRPRIQELRARAELGDRVTSALPQDAERAVIDLAIEATAAATVGDADRCEALLARGHELIDAARRSGPSNGSAV